MKVIHLDLTSLRFDADSPEKPLREFGLVRFETFRRKSLNARQAAGSFDIIPMSQSESGENDE